jgi:hypothetical protein
MGRRFLNITLRDENLDLPNDIQEVRQVFEASGIDE